VATCKICRGVRRKATSESWVERMCNDCYMMTEHFTWQSRWRFLTYNQKLITDMRKC